MYLCSTYKIFMSIGAIRFVKIEQFLKWVGSLIERINFREERQDEGLSPSKSTKALAQWVERG